MYTILAWAIIVTSATFLLLTVVIVVSKAWRETLELRYRRRRKRLEPQVLQYVHGDQSTISDVIPDATASDVPVLERVLLDNIQQVRGIERERMTLALDDLGSIDRWLDRLDHRRWWSRAAAAEKLGQSGSPRAAAGLVRTLNDATPEVRMRAAKGLGVLGGGDAIRVLIGALNEPNRWSTIRVADILTGMGRRVVDELTSRFDELETSGKLAALDVLGRIRPLQSVPWLVGHLDDSHPDIRARACHALGCIADPHTASDLARALQDDEWPVRAMAAKALGRTKSAESLGALRGALADQEWWVRSNAARALRSIGQRGLRILEEALGDDDRFARHQAVLMLQESGVVDARIAELNHPNDEVRAKAKRFAQHLVDAGQTDRLQVAASEHATEKVREALKAILSHGAGEASA
ncbi:MAG: HEAT repeat domain-containing protein [Acidobacteriota bacterium]|nr:HEAT repeat domain-containing protein [Acidobacteriota bacterium]MDH3784780.1 HEAT repeat domain-containing protein [Acidobacteriota bacterium]